MEEGLYDHAEKLSVRVHIKKAFWERGSDFYYYYYYHHDDGLGPSWLISVVCVLATQQVSSEDVIDVHRIERKHFTTLLLMPS